mgnify:CR=1 FL=1
MIVRLSHLSSLGSLVLSLIFALPAASTVWLVDPGGGGDFIEIQAAINAAASGDQILVEPGTYVENLDYLGKDLVVESIGGPDVTTIDGANGPAGERSTVRFVSAEPVTATLRGFRVTGGQGSVVEPYGLMGGGILLGESSATIEDCWVEDNEAEYGAGLRAHYAELVILDCIFRHNQSLAYGAATSSGWSTVTIENTLFEENTSATGDGAVSFGQENVLHLHGCTFLDNYGPSGAGLNIGQISCTGTVSHCHFEGNHAHSMHGGGMRIHEATLTVAYCSFLANEAFPDGGGLMVLDGAQPHVHHCTFYGNQAGRHGGQVAAWDFADAIFEHCIFADGLANGGFFVSNCSPIISCCDAWNNAGGNYLGLPDPTGHDGNIAADPLFCDAWGGDLQLASDSPCAEENNPECGQIGAFGIGCQQTPVLTGSWGSIKGLFR